MFCLKMLPAAPCYLQGFGIIPQARRKHLLKEIIWKE